MTQRPGPPLQVWWAIWLALQSGVVVLYFMLGNNSPEQTMGGPGSMLWLAAVVPIALGTLIRVFVLSRFNTAIQAFPFFVIGIAMAESATFLGIFLFPERKLELFILSLLGMAHFVPFFAKRYYE